MPVTPGTLGTTTVILATSRNFSSSFGSKPRISMRRSPRKAPMMRVNESLNARSNLSDNESAIARSPFAICESRRAVTRFRIASAIARDSAGVSTIGVRAAESVNGRPAAAAAPGAVAAAVADAGAAAVT